MAINWKELEAVLSETPLLGSYIQDITEHSYHSFTLSLYNSEKKSFLCYTEIASPHSRFCMTDHMREKEKNMQRFTQYLKAHIRGKKITKVYQLPYDRAFILTLSSPSLTVKMLFSLYSGPNANVVILDDENRILEVMFRRPKRGIVKGETLALPVRDNEGIKNYTLRPYSTDTISETIDKEEGESDKNEKRDEYCSLLLEKKNREIYRIDEKIKKTEERLECTKGYELIKHTADLFSSYLHLYKSGMERITLPDWENGGELTFPLEKRLNGKENQKKLYDDYHKAKREHSNALEELEKLKAERENSEKRYALLLSPNTPIEKLKKELEGEKKDANHVLGKPGLYLKSGDWEIIVGRNAKENDQILRQSVRGNDIWLHTRDYQGGYVIIKSRRNKTVPLPVLLDASYLAIFFSKARKNNKADLYYTEVKYLKRIKGAKLGLIIPTQEKNLTVEMDEERVRRILG